MPSLRLAHPPVDPWASSTPVPKKLLDRATADAVLADWFNADLLPFDVAKKHDLTIDELIAFVRSDAACHRCKQLEELAVERARTIATLHLPGAIHYLTLIIQERHAHSASEVRLAASAIIRYHHCLTSPQRRGAPPSDPSRESSPRSLPPVPAAALRAASFYTHRLMPSDSGAPVLTSDNQPLHANGHASHPPSPTDTSSARRRARDPSLNGHAKHTSPRATSPPRRR